MSALFPLNCGVLQLKLLQSRQCEDDVVINLGEFIQAVRGFSSALVTNVQCSNTGHITESYYIGEMAVMADCRIRAFKVLCTYMLSAHYLIPRKLCSQDYQKALLIYLRY